MANGVKIDREHLKPVPIGKSDWEGFCQTNYTVDKTLLIKELLDDDTNVALFTRPRRFGKTTALRMLKAFFEKTLKGTSCHLQKARCADPLTHTGKEETRSFVVVLR